MIFRYSSDVAETRRAKLVCSKFRARGRKIFRDPVSGAHAVVGCEAAMLVVVFRVSCPVLMQRPSGYVTMGVSKHCHVSHPLFDVSLFRSFS